MLSVSLYSKLVGNVYTLDAIVTGAVGTYTVTWKPTDTNRPTLTGNQVIRKFGAAAKAWSENVVVADSSGNTATAVIHLDLTTDSPIPPPPPVGTVKQIPIDAATESLLAGLQVNEQFEFDGPTKIIPGTRSS